MSAFFRRNWIFPLERLLVVFDNGMRVIVKDDTGNVFLDCSRCSCRATHAATTVESAYRRERSKHHPDRGGDAAQFQRVQRAYEQACEVLV